MQEPAVLFTETESHSTQHIVHALVQFAITVRHRFHMVLAALASCGLLAGLYYATATRYYSAKAELLVIQSGQQGMSPVMTPQGTPQNSLMPTYENIIASAKVLEGALARLVPEDRRVDFPDENPSGWVGLLRKNLTVRALRNTNIIAIEYESKDPGVAVRVVNAVVQAYLDFMAKTHEGTAGEIVRVLSAEKDDIAAKLAQKELELQAAREQIGHLDVGLDTKSLHPLVQRAVNFNEALIAAQKERVALEASLAAVETAVRNGHDLQQFVLGMSDTVGRELLLSNLGFNTHDATSQAAVERQLIQDQATLETLQQYYGPNHPKVVTLLHRIRLNQEYLAGYQDRIRQRLAQIQGQQLGPMLLAIMQQRLHETWQRELAIQSQYEQARADASQLNSRLAEIEILENDIAGLRELRTALVKRITGIDLSNDLQTAIVSEPTENCIPVSPNLPKVVLMALLAGLGLGLLAVYVLDTLDDRFRSVEDLQTQLRTPVLAIVQQLRPSPQNGLAGVQLYAAPDAPESEAFRTLRTALSLAERPSQRLVVSSAEPGDGKSTVLANLAVAYAQSDKRTLLIDADLRRPGLTTMLGFRSQEGLSGLLRGTASVASMAPACIQATGLPGLDFLPAGPRPSHPAELLAGPRLEELVAWAETVYDQVLIDSPPVLAASDTALIGRLTDGLLLVVQPDKNRRRLVLRVVENLAVWKMPLLGIVINRVGADKNRGYYGYSTGYGYSCNYGTDALPEDDAPDTPHGPTQTLTLAAGRIAGDDDPSAPQIVPRRAAS